MLCGAPPAAILADGGMATGPILAGLEARQITGYLPVESNKPGADNPALRDDPTVPVPEHQFGALPLNACGQLDRSCFVYVAERDEYICPNGRTLPYESRETTGRRSAEA